MGTGIRSALIASSAILLLGPPALAQTADPFSRGKDAYLLGNYLEAATWFRLAAEQGVADAQFILGVMYENGQGVPQDHAEAVRWYRLAAEQGHANAQYNLGVSYVIGEGVPKNYILGYKWFNLAAAGGHEDAAAARERLSRLMTPAQIAEGQRLSSEAFAKGH